MDYTMEVHGFTAGRKHSVVRDESGRIRFRVSRAGLSLGDDLTLRDARDQVAVRIVQDLPLKPGRYAIRRGETRLAEVRSECGFLTEHFTVERPDGSGYRVRGGILGMRFVFTRGETEVARVSVVPRRVVFYSYRVRIEDGEDDLVILATCAVISQVMHRRKM